MVSHLSHQELKQFPTSRVWGCETWQSLSSRCREHLEKLSRPELLAGEDGRLLQEQFAESLLDCYLHMRVCFRCRSSDTSALAPECGMEQVCHADVPRAEFRDLLDGEEAEEIDDRDFDSLPLISAVPPSQGLTSTRARRRFNVPAWNIEVALSQRL